MTSTRRETATEATSQATSASQGLDFRVDRDDYHRIDFAAAEIPTADELAEGQVLFRIDRFALTSNNVSYAAAGDLLGYWDFFPAPGRWGRIPAMGFGDVVASRHAEIEVGGRYFGFFPMSRHLVVEADPNRSGLVDRAAHRAAHAPTYRSYSETRRDPHYDESREDLIPLLRGLFLTSYLIDDAFEEAGFYGADRTILTSASSKTAIALAFLLRQRNHGAVIGLTSARNESFVRSLGCYDEVVRYEAIDQIEPGIPSILVDMAGNQRVLARAHERLGEALRHSCSVGATHWDAGSRGESLPGPEPEFFFAPTRIAKRSEDWGASGLEARIGSAWRAFAADCDRWLHVARERGAEAVERTYRDALGGRLDPAEGHLLSLWP